MLLHFYQHSGRDVVAIQLPKYNQNHAFQLQIEHTCNHFHIHSKIQSPPYCLCTVMPRWVKERHETNKLPWASSTLLPSFWNFLHNCTKYPIKEVLVRKRSNIIQEEKSGTSYVIYHRIRKERTEILLPGMLLQVILNLALQTYQSQHELYAQFPTYCGRDLESKNHIAERKLR